MIYLLMFVGAARWRELSLVDELLSEFTQCLTDPQTNKQSITRATSKQRQRRQKHAWKQQTRTSSGTASGKSSNCRTHRHLGPGLGQTILWWLCLGKQEEAYVRTQRWSGPRPFLVWSCHRFIEHSQILTVPIQRLKYF